MLSLTIKKTVPIIFHINGAPVARMRIPSDGKHNQLGLHIDAIKTMGVDRESVFNDMHPNVNIAASIARQELVMLSAIKPSENAA